MANDTKLADERLDQAPPLADWLVALSHDSPFERPQPGATLGEAFPRLSAVQSLLSLLTDSNSEVRRRAITALGNLGGEVRQVLPAIRATLEEAALHDGDDGVRAEAVRALLRTGPQPASEVGALLDALLGGVDVVRFHAAIALGDSGAAARRAVPALIHASLWDEERAVRVAAAMALGKIDPDYRDSLVVEVLSEALSDTSELICWIAAECLGQMGPTAGLAVPALQQALRRGFRISLVRMGVTLALERIRAQAWDPLESTCRHASLSIL